MGCTGATFLLSYIRYMIITLKYLTRNLYDKTKVHSGAIFCLVYPKKYTKQPYERIIF
jgi:hypothetical protein